MFGVSRSPFASRSPLYLICRPVTPLAGIAIARRVCIYNMGEQLTQ